ncbi:MAG TPA: hypothetical protein VM871_10640, partial [Flavisolibacter sp.]|nr:hypothetical protein [Flavisolibacter sp.]
LIKSMAKITERPIEAYFSEAAKIAKQAGFVAEGILRVCYYNNKGEEITRYFIDENNFAVYRNSFSIQIPSSEYIQAVTHCKPIVLSAEALKELSMTIDSWDSIINKITAKTSMEKLGRISPCGQKMQQQGIATFLTGFQTWRTTFRFQ